LRGFPKATGFSCYLILTGILAAAYQPLSNFFGVIAKASEERLVSIENSVGELEVQIERRTSMARRQAGSDRRKSQVPVEAERRGGERRNSQRRRQIDPTTCERDYSDEEIEFMRAMDYYKRASGRMFPTCSEILEVVRSLGYAKMPASESLEQPSA
jgi:hypothetical protein